MWVVKLTDKQLEVLRAMLRSEEHLGPALRGALEAMELARWDELPDAQLPGGASPTRPAARASRRPRSSGTSAGATRAGRAATFAQVGSPGGLTAGALTRTRRNPRPTSGPACPSATIRRISCGDASAPPPAPSRSRLSPIATATSRPTKSSSAQRPHRVPGAEPHAGVDVGRVHPGRLHQPHGLEQVGEEQPVDDEPGLVGDLDRGLAERRAPGARALADAAREPVRQAELDQLHARAPG